MQRALPVEPGGSALSHSMWVHSALHKLQMTRS